jgi:hypothetical protein
MRKIDLTDQKFDRLTVMEEAGHKDNHIAWRCLCDCGNEIVVQGSSLRRGATKSCGCLRKEKTIERATTHGMRNTRIYNSWNHMLQRIHNPNDSAYADYGGRGLTVCDKWLKFDGFYEDMGEMPEEKTIGRIDNDKGYYKENCHWETMAEQVINRRLNKTNKTGIVGVCWHKKIQKYQVNIGVDYKRIHLGYFTELQDAKQARKDAELKYW